MIGPCDLCRIPSELRTMILVPDEGIPLTDNNGVPLTEDPKVQYCEECIRKVKKNPILYTLKEIEHG